MTLTCERNVQDIYKILLLQPPSFLLPSSSTRSDEKKEIQSLINPFVISIYRRMMMPSLSKNHQTKNTSLSPLTSNSIDNQTRFTTHKLLSEREKILKNFLTHTIRDCLEFASYNSKFSIFLFVIEVNLIKLRIV